MFQDFLYLNYLTLHYSTVKTFSHTCTFVALSLLFSLCSVVSVTPVKTAPSNPDDDFWNVRDEEGVALSVIKEEADNGVGSMEVDKTVESAEVEQMDAEESCDIVTGQSDVNMEEGGGQLEEDTVLKIVQCLEELRKCIETSQHTIVSGRVVHVVCAVTDNKDEEGERYSIHS